MEGSVAVYKIYTIQEVGVLYQSVHCLYHMVFTTAPRPRKE